VISLTVAPTSSPARLTLAPAHSQKDAKTTTTRCQIFFRVPKDLTGVAHILGARRPRFPEPTAIILQPDAPLAGYPSERQDLAIDYPRFPAPLQTYSPTS
jgi:hypothetical protein